MGLETLFRRLNKSNLLIHKYFYEFNVSSEMSITSSDISPIDALLAFNKKFTFPGVVLFAKKSVSRL